MSPRRWDCLKGALPKVSKADPAMTALIAGDVKKYYSNDLLPQHETAFSDEVDFNLHDHRSDGGSDVAQAGAWWITDSWP